VWCAVVLCGLVLCCLVFGLVLGVGGVGWFDAANVEYEDALRAGLRGRVVLVVGHCCSLVLGRGRGWFVQSLSGSVRR
jgi:hypothetical protein